jgi:hypothetical protein
MTRTRCCNPFCRRTTSTERLAAKGHNEWLCPDHWRLVNPKLRLLYRRVNRKLKLRRSNVLEGIAYRTWEKCKREAVEVSGGLR